ncbi:MAG: FAD:protein FMN transferase [Opitutaceae bacterium]|nr:FAD:protein FMN transferase [Opitutaceae bacterium]
MNALPTSPPPTLAVGPRASDELTVVRWQALGTNCLLQIPTNHGETGQQFAQEVQRWVAAFEQRYSRFRPDSIISRINSSAGAWVAVDQETERILDVSAMVHRLTGGLLDVTSLPLQRLWDYRNPQPRVPTQVEIERARGLVGWERVERRPGAVRLPREGMGIDLGGWGKEYAVDAAADIGVQLGLKSFLVDFGHDIRAVGKPPGRPAWHIGLENPAAPGTHSGSIGILDRAVASSGDYQRHTTIQGRRFGHIVDPRTGWPVANGMRQATVVAPSCLQAGVLSTSAFILGGREGAAFVQQSMGCEACLVGDQARHQTRGFVNYVVT